MSNAARAAAKIRGTKKCPFAHVHRGSNLHFTKGKRRVSAPRRK